MVSFSYSKTSTESSQKDTQNSPHLAAEIESLRVDRHEIVEIRIAAQILIQQTSDGRHLLVGERVHAHCALDLIGASKAAEATKRAKVNRRSEEMMSISLSDLASC